MKKSLLFFISIVFLCYSASAISNTGGFPNSQECWDAISGQERVGALVQKIRELSVRNNMSDTVEIWQNIPYKKKVRVVKRIFTEEEATQVKSHLASVIDETNTHMPEINRILARILLTPEEFETREDNKMKQTVAEIIGKTKTRDAKTHDILVESLHFLRGTSRFNIRKEIYSLLEAVSQHITVRTGRKLAYYISPSSYLLPAEKKSIIAILRKIQAVDIQTVDFLGEGLSDLSPRVRQSSAQALGEMLGKESGFFRVLKTAVYAPFQSIAGAFKFLSDPSGDVVDDRIFYIIERLAYLSQHDSKLYVQAAAVEAIIQIHNRVGYYVVGIESLFESLQSDILPEAREATIAGLKENLYTAFQRSFFQLSRHILQERDEMIKRLVDLMYSRKMEIRSNAYEIFQMLLGQKKALKRYYEVQDLKARELEKRVSEHQESGARLNYIDQIDRRVYLTPQPFRSWFEVDVFLAIHAKGYLVIPQVVLKDFAGASSYSVDLMIVNGEGGSDGKNNSLYVECDGHHHNTIQEIDHQRNEAFEKDGKRVWRIRHSRQATPVLRGDPFYAAYSKWRKREVNSKALEGLWDELEKMGIKPIKVR
ncbi:MAG: hypothetical protein OXB86_03595 [Bdellovibrionales bacterium]|nr:hypothetical protein [Bdellovibrionales bacterium]